MSATSSSGMYAAAGSGSAASSPYSSAGGSSTQQSTDSFQSGRRYSALSNAATPSTAPSAVSSSSSFGSSAASQIMATAGSTLTQGVATVSSSSALSAAVAANSLTSSLPSSLMSSSANLSAALTASETRLNNAKARKEDAEASALEKVNEVIFEQAKAIAEFRKENETLKVQLKVSEQNNSAQIAALQAVVDLLAAEVKELKAFKQNVIDFEEAFHNHCHTDYKGPKAYTGTKKVRSYPHWPPNTAMGKLMHDVHTFGEIPKYCQSKEKDKK